MHNAVAVRQLHELCDLVGIDFALDAEIELDPCQRNGRGLVDCQCAAEIDFSFGSDRAAAYVQMHRVCDRGESDTRTTDQTSQHDLNRASERAIATTRLVHSGRLQERWLFDVA